MFLAIFRPDVTTWWAPGLAFVAGAVSFASPCVLPLVPGYVSLVTGAAVGEEGTKRPLQPILLFILGFSLVFTSLGAFSSTLVPLVRGTWGQRVGGIVVIAIGLLMLGYALGRGPLGLFAERRPFLEKVRPGRAGALPLGMAFAAGWTPCIGPVLAAILGLAFAEGTAWKAALLLLCYSLGLGLPFLLVGIGVRRLVGVLGWVKRNYRWITGASGAILISIGTLMATGKFTSLFAKLQRFAPGI